MQREIGCREMRVYIQLRRTLEGAARGLRRYRSRFGSRFGPVIPRSVQRENHVQSTGRVDHVIFSAKSTKIPRSFE